VFSAIVLLIGIIIFSEIAEAMELTLPLASVTPPLEAISLGNLTANDEWQLREQEFNVAATVNCDFVTNSTRILVELFPDKALQGYCHVFKVFDKSDIIGKDLKVTWNSSLDFTCSRIFVLDGSYDRNTASDFPLDTSSGCNLIGFSNPLKGAGTRLHLIFSDSNFSTKTDTITMTLAGSTLPQITIGIGIKDQDGNDRPAIGIDEVEIVGFAKWDWDSSSSATLAVTGTQNDLGITTVTAQSLLPLVLTSQDQVQVDTFNNAQAIGFTVVGILPVALFFALFSIFSGRIE